MWELIITSSIFILLVLLLRALCRGHISMRLQYGLWLLVAVKLLIFPVPWVESEISVLNLLGEAKQEENVVIVNDDTIFEPISAEDVQIDDMNGMNENAHSVAFEEGIIAEPISEQEARVEQLVTWIAAIGTLAMLLFFVGYNLSFWLYLKKNRIYFEKIEEKLSVYLVEGMPSACLFGKAIYLSPEIAADETRKKHVLAHEYAHYRQKDMIWSLVRGICLACYWWHPLVWVAAYVSKQDCELACDETAIKSLGDEERISYGKTLVGLIQVRTRPKDCLSLTTTMTGSGKSIKQRIKRIAKQPRILLSVCIVVIFGAVFGLFVTSTTGKENNVEISDNEADGLNEIETETNEIAVDHWFYEEFGTEEFYKLAASYEANVCHTVDNIEDAESKELIEVYTGNVGDGDSGFVLVNVPGNTPFSIEAHTARAGWKNIYLMESSGKAYIFTLVIDIRDTYGAISYEVYSFEEQVGENLAVMPYACSEFSYEKESFSEEEFMLWAEEFEPFLSNATLLLSTQDGEIRTDSVNEFDKYNKEALLGQIRENW